MATNTSNYSLVKPAYSDIADINDINGNMDKVDTALGALGDGFAIVSDNNTHVAITAGQYVYVRNHGSLAEGLYKANSNIAANATLTSSNLTAVSGGGLNDLAGDISALNGKIAKDLAMYNNSSAILRDGTTVQVTGSASMDAYNFIVFTMYYNGRQETKEIFIGGAESNNTYHLSIVSNGNDGHLRIFTIDFTIAGRYIVTPAVKYSYDFGAFQSYTGNDVVISAVRGYN